MPAVNVTSPAGGENFGMNSSVTLRWTGSSPAGMDSFVVYVSYDSFTTPPTRLAKRNANQLTFGWTTPNAPGRYPRTATARET